MVLKMYGLKDKHYAGFARHQLPHAHEFFVPIRMLTEEKVKTTQVAGAGRAGIGLVKFL